MRIRERVNLRVHRGEHVGMPVSEARHRGTTGGVEIALSTRVGDPATVTGHRDRVLTAQLAMGFLVTVVSIRFVPWFAGEVGWRWALLPLAAGPAVGIIAIATLPRAAGGKCPAQRAVAGVQHQVGKRRATDDRSPARCRGPQPVRCRKSPSTVW